MVTSRVGRFSRTRVGVLAGMLLFVAAGADGGRRSNGEPPGDVRPRGGRPRLVFSHAKHFRELDQACDSCHLLENDHRVPGMDICGGCHDSTESESESDCRICHVDTDLENLKAGESLPRGIGFRPKLWRCVHTRYDHALHAAEVRCTVCHPKAPASTKAEDVLYPSQRTFNCGLCHSSDPCVDTADQTAAKSEINLKGNRGSTP